MPAIRKSIADFKTQVVGVREQTGKQPTQTGGKVHDKFYVYIPRQVSNDSAFLFKANQKPKVRIDVENKRLVMKKAE